MDDFYESVGLVYKNSDGVTVTLALEPEATLDLNLLSDAYKRFLRAIGFEGVQDVAVTIGG